MTAIDNIHRPLNRNSRVYTSKERVKNSIFFDNASYEEELFVFKEIEQQRKVIEAKEIEKKNFLEKITYGIYLISKLRQDGQNLEEIPIQKISALFCWKPLQVSIRNRKSFLQFFACILLNFFACSLIGVFEYYFLVKCWDHQSFEFRIDHSIFILMIIIASLIVLNQLTKHLLWSNLYFGFVKDCHHKTISQLLKPHFSWVDRIRFYRVLNKTSQHSFILDTKIFNGIHNITYNASWVIFSFLSLIYIYSFLLPLIIISLYCFMVYYVYKKIMPSYLKATSLESFNKKKAEDFIFQLLNQIQNHRMTLAINTLNHKFLRIIENNLKTSKLVNSDYLTLFLEVTHLLGILFVICIALLSLVFINVQSLNWLNLEKLYFLWGFVSLYRIIHHTESLVYSVLNYMSNCLDLSTECSAQNKYEKNDTNINMNRLLYSSCTFDYKKPIVMKNVSLTLGYQPILKKISFKVKLRQRVGILGVEGGGRSAIFDLLAGLKHPDQKIVSKISIFGLKIHEIVNEELRESIHLSKRVPNLFQGTMRENIDPFERHTDQYLMQLLLDLGIDRIISWYTRTGKSGIRNERKLMDEIGNPGHPSFESAVRQVKIVPTVTPPIAIQDIKRVQPKLKIEFEH